jgi:ABC-type molybdate transport system permease subunit
MALPTVFMGIPARCPIWRYRSLRAGHDGSGDSMMVGGNIKWHTRTIATAIALETNKEQFGMGVALGLVLLASALCVNVSVSFLRRRY